MSEVFSSRSGASAASGASSRSGWRSVSVNGAPGVWDYGRAARPSEKARDDGQHRLAITLELALADAIDRPERSLGARTAGGDVGQGLVVEDDIGRHVLA